MGAIKFPHASGNSMSITSPATNPASDLELKLPATVGTAGQVLKNSSTAGTLEFGAAGGITEVDNWRVSADLAGDQDPVSSNWERADRAPAISKLGTGMSVSSGIWTFPSTGIWLVQCLFWYGHSSEIYYASWALQGTPDNGSNWYNSYQGLGASVSDESSNCYGQVSGWGIFDITDTSTHKIKLRINSNPDVTWTGDTYDSKNSMIFIKLAET
tara:strand:+ start:186 stop:827 length:642 start_codon:yes stop_codon:yes gene_type:complete